MNKKVLKKFWIKPVFIFLICLTGYSQTPIRVGTTAANFLEIGYGTAGVAMGDACVSHTNDLSSIYWNPAGLAYMNHSEVMFIYQPWIVDINTSFVAVGIVIPSIGTISLGLISVNYGNMEVTTLAMQEGTGEIFSPNDMSFSLSYARKLTDWFSIGTSAKYISSNILHTNASAFAMDFGVIINTYFFSPYKGRENGLKIGMSISNYGTRMKYNGMDLMNPIDISPYEEGNFRDVPGQFGMQDWELPLIFRMGVSLKPIVTESHEILLTVDALHPNNNSESVNAGMQYTLISPSFGKFYLRAGYKALFMENSEYGLTLGGGVVKNFFGNNTLKIDYFFRDIGILGTTHGFGLNYGFDLF